MTSAVFLDLRGSVNRRVNCDAANLDKAVEAAMSQVEAIRWLEQEGKLITVFFSNSHSRSSSGVATTWSDIFS